MGKIALKIRDISAADKILNEITISLQSDKVAVKEIIEARVTSEVENYNNKLPEYFNGLVQPSNAEKALNGFKMKERKKIDPEKQVYIALDAFQKNGYFILIDNLQAESLEQIVEIQPSTEINFLKLTPLVGG